MSRVTSINVFKHFFDIVILFVKFSANFDVRILCVTNKSTRLSDIDFGTVISFNFTDSSGGKHKFINCFIL